MTDTTPANSTVNPWGIVSAILGGLALAIGLLLLLIPSVDEYGQAADLDLARLLTGIAITAVGGTLVACWLLLAGIAHLLRRLER